MSLDHTAFSRAGFALTAIASLALGGSAYAQPPLKSSPVKGSPTQTVERGQCLAFGKYVLDEDDAFPGKLSSTFLDSVGRFVAAKCTTRDAKGEIQLITMNDQDNASLRTSLRLMGKFDLIGVSGIKGCHRPPAGACPANTTSAPGARVGS